MRSPLNSVQSNNLNAMKPFKRGEGGQLEKSDIS